MPFKTFNSFESSIKFLVNRYRAQSGYLYGRQLDALDNWCRDLIAAYELYDSLDEEEYLRLLQIANPVVRYL